VTRALALARRIVVDDRPAEDVVQEALLACWRNPAGFDAARGSFGSSLLALGHHKVVDAVRRETSQRRRLDAAAELEQPSRTSRRASPTGWPMLGFEGRWKPTRPGSARRSYRRSAGHGEDPDARRDAPTT
jgi:DNA-directed RNA polymerase specialized sigma24 family protein